MKSIIELLNENKKVSAWKLTEVETESCELFYILKNLETNRATNTKDISLTIYVDGDGTRGSSDVVIYSHMGEEEIKNAIMPSVNYFKSENVDTVILGCTHFLHLSKEIADCVGKDILVVDSREGVANQALRVFKKHIFSNVEKCENKIDVKDKTFFVTSEKSSKHEYETLSKKLNLPYGGLLSN